MFNVHVIVYPWDLEDEGIDAVLDRLQGELGVAGVIVPAASGLLRQLRRHANATPRVFQSRGGFFFQPTLDAYDKTRIKPVVSGWLKARNPLARIADACRTRDIDLRAAVDTRRIERLAVRYPDIAAKTPFGDASTTRVCPQNPDAAELFRAMVGDLSRNYALSAVELRDISRPRETVPLDDADLRSLGRTGGELHALCCCESCLQAASRDGIDTDAAVRSAQAALAGALESGHRLDMPFDEFLDGDEPLRAYVRNRVDAHKALIESFTGRIGGDCVMHLDRADDVAMVSAADRIVIDAEPVPQGNDRPGRGALERIRRHLASVPVEARVLSSAAADATALVKTLKHLADRPFAGVVLDHYGRMNEPALTSAKQAVRYARRTADA